MMAAEDPEAGNPRAALIALVAATGGDEGGLALCSTLMDRAGQLLLSAPVEVLAAAGGDAGVAGRLASLALINRICAGCRSCPRGEALAGELADIGRPPRRWRARR